MICLSCQKKLLSPPMLCLSCESQFLPLELLQTNYGISLYPYHSHVGLWIKEVKIHHSYAHKQILEHLVLNSLKNPSVHHFFSQADAFTPAPSSLWSRVMGKADVAYFLADFLSQYYCKPLTLLSKKFYASWKKQSFQKDRKNIDISFLKKSIDSKNSASHTIFVDDVITTGQTFMRCSSYFSNPIVYWTLAYGSKLKDI